MSGRGRGVSAISRLIVVSNRVAPPDPRRSGSAGGLAIAVGAALKGRPGFWFGWSGETTDHFTSELKTRRVGEIDTVTIDLEEGDFQEYYNGYANASLWPLFHDRIDLTDYERSYGEGYHRVNRRFAEALAPLLRPDDVIWVHDYHLIPLAQALRSLGVKNPIGFFLHIPWPAPQLLTTLPRHRQLVESMFAYDLIGLQTDEWLAAFEGYVLGEAEGSRGPNGRLRAFGRSVRAEAFPIGLDTPDFEKAARSRTADRAFDRIAAHSAFRSLIIGVERLDYTKGLEERLAGFEQFLRDHPDQVRQVQYLQIAPTSRGEVEAYQALSARVWALAGRINAAWAEIDWAPIQLVSRAFGRAELAGAYRAARVGLVTPLRDGMNLVAKEYVAAQDPSDPGVLILSRFAGAAREMRDALIVNPYSREELADALARALSMSRSERLRRWEPLMDGVRRGDVNAWRDRFIDALEAAQPASVA